MPRYAVAFGLAIFMAGGIVAYAVSVPGTTTATETSVVSPFDLTLKARDLPSEPFGAI
jgi:hypothetical protein